MNNKLRVIDKTYPNGHTCKQLMFGDKILGSYTVEAGGYLPHGKRKPRPEEMDAILDIIKSQRRAAIKHLDWLETAWDAAFEQQNEFKGKAD